jgi:hypothetical protein
LAASIDHQAVLDFPCNCDEPMHTYASVFAMAVVVVMVVSAV